MKLTLMLSALSLVVSSAIVAARADDAPQGNAGGAVQQQIKSEKIQIKKDRQQLKQDVQKYGQSSNQVISDKEALKTERMKIRKLKKERRANHKSMKRVDSASQPGQPAQPVQPSAPAQSQ